MSRWLRDHAAPAGVLLVLAVTLAGAGADGATKHLAGRIAAPQLYFFSGLGVALACALMARPGIGEIGRPGRRQRLGTRFVGLMALRSLLVAASATFYYHAFACLPLAEVFVFIGLTPLLAAALAAPVLGERVAGPAWLALGAGACGVLFLFLDGIGRLGSGHLMAAGGVATGALSLVLMRRMTRHEPNSLAQVFWPHLVMAGVMGLALPGRWQAMDAQDCLLVAAYVLAVFIARWLMVPAVTRLRVHTAMMLMNLQFVWMVALDRLVFGHGATGAVLVGALCIIGAGCYLVLEQASQGEPSRRRHPATPALQPAE